MLAECETPPVSKPPLAIEMILRCGDGMFSSNIHLKITQQGENGIEVHAPFRSELAGAIFSFDQLTPPEEKRQKLIQLASLIKGHEQVIHFQLQPLSPSEYLLHPNRLFYDSTQPKKICFPNQGLVELRTLSFSTNNDELAALFKIIKHASRLMQDIYQTAESIATMIEQLAAQPNSTLQFVLSPTTSRNNTPTADSDVSPQPSVWNVINLSGIDVTLIGPNSSLVQPSKIDVRSQSSTKKNELNWSKIILAFTFGALALLGLACFILSILSITQPALLPLSVAVLPFGIKVLGTIGIGLLTAVSVGLGIWFGYKINESNVKSSPHFNAINRSTSSYALLASDDQLSQSESHQSEKDWSNCSDFCGWLRDKTPWPENCYRENRSAILTARLEID